MPIPKHDWISRYLKLTHNTEPPLLYKEWVACSTIAAVLQRKYKLRWGTLTFYPNMYVVLVGPSGRCRKGVAMSTGHRFLREIGIKTTAEAVTREALIRDLAESAVTSESADGKPIIHSSLTVFSKELAVFLGQDNKNLMSDLTDWYDCDDKWTYRTKGSGTDEIVGVWLNLIGATTPELVQTQLPRDAIGGGLSSRIIFVFEDRKEKSVATPFLTEEQKALEKELLEDLDWMYTLTGDVKYDESFLEYYIWWYENRGTKDEFREGPLSYYNERRANHVMRLSIIMAASQRETVLTKQILQRAINMLERTEVKMPRTFGGYGSAEKSDILHKVQEAIATRGRTTRRDILKNLHYEIDDLKQLDSMISILQALNFCRVRHTETDTIIEYNRDQEIGKEFLADNRPGKDADE